MIRRRADEDFAKFERAFRTVVPSYKGTLRRWGRKFAYLFNRNLDCEIRQFSKNPNLRCLSCGWLYNLNLVESCPKCHSQKSRVLSEENPFANPGIWLLVLIADALLLFGAYRLVS